MSMTLGCKDIVIKKLRNYTVYLSHISQIKAFSVPRNMTVRK